MLERVDPLHGVLGRHPGFDHALVIGPGCAGQRHPLAGLGGLLGLLCSLVGVAPPIALVDRVDTAFQQLSGLVGKLTSAGEAVAGLGGTAAPCNPQAHLAPLAGSGRETEHPTGGLRADSEQQSATIRVITLACCPHLTARQQMQLRCG